MVIMHKPNLVHIFSNESDRQFLFNSNMSPGCLKSMKGFELDFHTSMMDEKLDTCRTKVRYAVAQTICALYVMRPGNLVCLIWEIYL